MPSTPEPLIPELDLDTYEPSGLADFLKAPAQFEDKSGTVPENRDPFQRADAAPVTHPGLGMRS